MGAAGGPNMVEDGMVFYYDTGNSKSYKGEPTTNLANTDSARTMANYGGGTLTTAAAPEKGPGWKKITITAINGSNFRLAKFPYINMPTNTTRTWSLELDFNGTSGYYVRGDGYNGMGPNVSTNGVHSWTKVTTTTTGNMALFLNNGSAAVTGLNDVIYYRYYQVEDNAHKTPFTDGTRSATEGLKDFTNNSTIDLTNVSFDSNAQMTFDGTNDDINIGPGTSTSFQRTIEMVFKTNTIGYLYPLAAYTRGGGQSVVTGKRMWLGFQDNKFRMHGWGTSDPASTTTIQTGQYYHAVYAYDQVTKKHYIWINGVLENNSTNDQSGFTGWSASGDHNWFVGGDPDCASWSASAGRSLNGDIPIFKVYDRILSTEEVKNHFNGIRSRFGI